MSKLQAILAAAKELDDLFATVNKETSFIQSQCLNAFATKLGEEANKASVEWMEEKFPPIRNHPLNEMNALLGEGVDQPMPPFRSTQGEILSPIIPTPKKTKNLPFAGMF